MRESDKFVTSQTVCDNPFVCTLGGFPAFRPSNVVSLVVKLVFIIDVR